MLYNTRYFFGFFFKFSVETKGPNLFCWALLQVLEKKMRCSRSTADQFHILCRLRTMFSLTDKTMWQQRKNFLWLLLVFVQYKSLLYIELFLYHTIFVWSFECSLLPTISYKDYVRSCKLDFNPKIKVFFSRGAAV
jgi:hypothetical protein